MTDTKEGCTVNGKPFSSFSGFFFFVIRFYSRMGNTDEALSNLFIMSMSLALLIKLQSNDLYQSNYLS